MKLKTRLHIPVIREFLDKQIVRYNTSDLNINVWSKLFSKKEKKELGTNGGECVPPLKNENYKIRIWIDEKAHYPQDERCEVSTIKNRFIFDKVRVHNKDESLAWILGHEFWHYLCFTKQESGNVETKANTNGFKWLRIFRKRYESLQDIKR